MTSGEKQSAILKEPPVLGQAAGLYWERAPRPSLQRHFASVWFHEKPQGCPSQTAVVPDAFADLIWIGGKLLVAGPDEEVSLESVPPGASVVGVRLQPGTLQVWLGVPASEIVGARIPLDCLTGKKAQEWSDAIGDARNPAIVAARLEELLAQTTAKIESPDAPSKLILEYLASARNQRGPITRRLLSALGTSERTLRRTCEIAFGFGPKTLDRVLRIHRFLGLAASRPAPNLASLAVEAGYADQAHLTREARRLTGLSPAMVLAQLRAAVSGGAQESEVTLHGVSL